MKKIKLIVFICILLVEAIALADNDDDSAVAERIQQEASVTTNPYIVALYKPSYILPFYYTGSPYESLYKGTTPEDQKVKQLEFKAQFSFKLPVIMGLLGKHSSLEIAYTQLMYWQFYVKSQYFRETDYEPEIFIHKRIIPNWWADLGVVHQSNGRGGEMERSWNRTYLKIVFSRGNWMVNLRPWVLIFTSDSSDLHNKDISKYLGHGDAVVAYKIAGHTVSVMLRNQLESGFKRGAVELDWSFPIYKAIKGYVQFFSGYGQSLIEYNHRTDSCGIGLVLSDWN